MTRPVGTGWVVRGAELSAVEPRETGLPLAPSTVWWIPTGGGRCFIEVGYPLEVRRDYRTGGFEDIAGYARGVRVDQLIAVSATAATDESGRARFPGDVYAQTKAAFEQALEAVEALGGDLAGVLRTRMYLAPGCEWRCAVDAHRELFAEVRPANVTFYAAGFIPEGVLVEVELDAVVSDAHV